MHFFDTLALIMNLHNAGYNMVPQWGWRQAIDAYLIPKLGKWAK